MSHSPRAAIITIGSELTEGLRIDSNTATIARAISGLGFKVTEAVSVGDDVALLAQVIRRLTSVCELVVATGGLGPTHDDVTREASALALCIDLHQDPKIAEWLAGTALRQADAASREAVLSQAQVLAGAKVLAPCTGTAPGQIVPTPEGSLVLLPGPPREMSEMLERALAGYTRIGAGPRDLGVTGMSESDVQHAAQRALAGRDDITLTVLAKPGDVRVLLIDAGAGQLVLDEMAAAVASELGPACYTTVGETLAEATVAMLSQKSMTLSTAESCTGGLVSAALTDVPGVSEVFLGGVVSYANSVKGETLKIPAGLLAQYGAVSEQTAAAMAEGVRTLMDSDIAVSVTGVAGPGGGTPEKPVGMVWFALSHASGTEAFEARFHGGSRDSIRARATAKALDAVRRHLLDNT